MTQQEETAASAQQDINKMAYEKPKISYATIRKNTNLDKFFVKKTKEENKEEAKETE